MLINHIKQISPQAIIILLSPMQRADFVYHFDVSNTAHGSYKDAHGQALSSFAAAVAQIAEHEQCHFIDLYHHEDLRVSDMVHFKRVSCPSSGGMVYVDLPFLVYTDGRTDGMTPCGGEEPRLHVYPEEAARMTVDGLHPSDMGHALIADLVADVLLKTLGT